MTNLAIITDEAINQGIFTKEQAEEILEAGFRLPIHTFAEWKRLGYFVKKGEKARMICRIWRHRGDSSTAIEDEEIEENGNFYLTKAFFFTLDQVQAVC